MNATFAYLGAGWAMPIKPDGAGRLNVVSGPEKVRESIFIILDTEPGERLMRADFGCGLRRYLMKPNNPSTRALIQRQVSLSLKLWEPRIDVKGVNVTPGEDPALAMIEISYVHKRDGQPGNLVYPFYLQ